MQDYTNRRWLNFVRSDDHKSVFTVVHWESLNWIFTFLHHLHFLGEQYNLCCHYRCKWSGHPLCYSDSYDRYPFYAVCMVADINIIWKSAVHNICPQYLHHIYIANCEVVHDYVLWGSIWCMHCEVVYDYVLWGSIWLCTTVRYYMIMYCEVVYDVCTVR